MTNTIDLVVISRADYTTLCLIAGLGWGLWTSTFIAAIIINSIKWHKWINGQ
mgnify:CR=1 FL=1